MGARRYTPAVPTGRPRHTLTETDELLHTLDLAGRRWPEDRGRRTRLLVRGLGDWTREHDEDRARHREAIEQTSGSMTGLFPEGYLDALREVVVVGADGPLRLAELRSPRGSGCRTRHGAWADQLAIAAIAACGRWPGAAIPGR